MLESLLPNKVATASVRDDDPFAYLYPDEAALLGRAVESRVREFSTGRACARRALRKLGVPATSILSGPNREPLWPAGVIGSITHCHGYRAATVAWQVHFQTVGIDAEIHEPLPSGVLSHVAVAEEQAWLLEAHGGLHWDRLLFSAKESVYKAWFPITGRWLDFKDAVVTFDPIQQTFYAKITLSPLIGESAFLTDFSGRYLTYDDLVLTAITVPQR